MLYIFHMFNMPYLIACCTYDVTYFALGARAGSAVCLCRAVAPVCGAPLLSASKAYGRVGVVASRRIPSSLRFFF